MVVVIAILASITIVSYNGISKRAKDSAIQSNLSNGIQKLELFKLNDGSGVYPATLSAAGLNSFTNSGDTTYAYGVSSDYKSYCLAMSQGGRTYYITSTVMNPKTGICNGAVGVPGTGDVAVDGSSSTPATNYSVFNTTVPDPNLKVYNDGNGSLKTGNRFYTNETSGIKVTGLRIYNPVGPDTTSAYLSADVTAYAYTHNWTGVNINGATTFAQSPVATKTYSGTRTAGTWTDILFDSPVTIAPKNAASGPVDYVTLAVQYAGGTYYVFTSTLYQFDSINSTTRPNTYLTLTQNIGRSVNTMASSDGDSYYGIDILFTPVTP